jgi:hypothetical protein
MASEEPNRPQQLTKNEIEHIAARVTKSFKGDNLDRVAEQVVNTIQKDDWKPLANQFVRSFNIIADSKRIAELLLSMPMFWFRLGLPSLVIGWGILMGIGGWVPKSETARLLT